MLRDLVADERLALKLRSGAFDVGVKHLADGLGADLRGIAEGEEDGLVRFGHVLGRVEVHLVGVVAREFHAGSLPFHKVSDRAGKLRTEVEVLVLEGDEIQFRGFDGEGGLEVGKAEIPRVVDEIADETRAVLLLHAGEEQGHHGVFETVVELVRRASVHEVAVLLGQHGVGRLDEGGVGLRYEAVGVGVRKHGEDFPSFVRREDGRVRGGPLAGIYGTRRREIAFLCLFDLGVAGHALRQVGDEHGDAGVVRERDFQALRLCGELLVVILVRAFFGHGPADHDAGVVDDDVAGVRIDDGDALRRGVAAEHQGGVRVVRMAADKLGGLCSRVAVLEGLVVAFAVVGCDDVASLRGVHDGVDGSFRNLRSVRMRHVRDRDAFLPGILIVPCASAHLPAFAASLAETILLLGKFRSLAVVGCHVLPFLRVRLVQTVELRLVGGRLLFAGRFSAFLGGFPLLRVGRLLLAGVLLLVGCHFRIPAFAFLLAFDGDGLRPFMAGLPVGFALRRFRVALHGAGLVERVVQGLKGGIDGLDIGFGVVGGKFRKGFACLLVVVEQA